MCMYIYIYIHIYIYIYIYIHTHICLHDSYMHARIHIMYVTPYDMAFGAT